MFDNFEIDAVIFDSEWNLLIVVFVKEESVGVLKILKDHTGEVAPEVFKVPVKGCCIVDFVHAVAFLAVAFEGKLLLHPLDKLIRQVQTEMPRRIRTVFKTERLL